MDRVASAEDVKAAYKRQALKWHPDRNRDNQAEAEKQFKRVSKAYSLLSDPQQREVFDRFGFDPQSGASPAGSRARPVTEEEAMKVFRQMFGNKPLHEIIREVEMSVQQQQKQMAHKEFELRDRARQLRKEAAELEMRARLAAQTQRHREAKQAQRLAVEKTLEADRTDKELQAVFLQHNMERTQQNFAVNRLRRLDPAEQALNRVRIGIAWGVGLSAYFFWGWSALGSVCAFLIASFCARVGIAVLRRFKNVRRT